MSEVPQGDGIEVRLQQAAGLPEILSAGFDAFEVIRVTARQHQDQEPRLFAAFMTAADTAVDGREALTLASSLPHEPGMQPVPAGPGLDASRAADTLATVAALLHDRLSHAVTLARETGDLAACRDAAEAAGQIRQLMIR
jgi:hypothetical protein